MCSEDRLLMLMHASANRLHAQTVFVMLLGWLYFGADLQCFSSVLCNHQLIIYSLDHFCVSVLWAESINNAGVSECLCVWTSHVRLRDVDFCKIACGPALKLLMFNKMCELSSDKLQYNFSPSWQIRLVPAENTEFNHSQTPDLCVLVY